GRVARPAIRSTATIGGNLAYAEPASDPAPALCCLEATVDIAGAAGSRSLPVARFLTGFYETALEPAEVVAAVRIPAVPAGARGGHGEVLPRPPQGKPPLRVRAPPALQPPHRPRPDR